MTGMLRSMESKLNFPVFPETSFFPDRGSFPPAKEGNDDDNDGEGLKLLSPVELNAPPFTRRGTFLRIQARKKKSRLIVT